MTVETASTIEADADTGGAEETIVCENPATGEVIGEVGIPSPDQLEEAVATARDAQSHWARIPAEERADYLLEAREILLDHRAELKSLIVEETGKAPPDALAELLTVFDTMGFYAEEGPDLVVDEQVDLHLLKNKQTVVQKAPVGVVLNISPWNFPFDLSMTPVMPALVAGNAVVVKPSEYTPKTAIRAAELINRAGFPEGLIQVLPGGGETGARLIERADAVSFTGSVETGRVVARSAAEQLIPATLELGGKDPLIVLEDADVERAARGAVWGAFFNSGQCCMSVERAYVHEAVFEDFIARAVELTENLRQGVPGSGEIDVGAMTFPEQIEIVESHVEQAREHGARVRAGGDRLDVGEGDFYRPTVLTDVDHQMDVMVEETFGPVLPVMEVPSAAEAIRLANDTPYGLNSSIWSADRDRAERFARRIDAGNVCINDVIASYVAIEAPYGGNGDSGLGRRKGRWEIEEFVAPKTIMTDLIGLDREPYWYPYSGDVERAVDKLFDALYRNSYVEKITGLFSS